MNTHFSELLDTFMKKAAISTSELARRIDINRHTLRRWRHGEVNEPNCRKVLACLPHLRLTEPRRYALLRAAGCSVNEPLHGAATDENRLSPFVMGQPVVHSEQFCGRELVVEQIIELWRRLPLQNVAIIGPRRYGKSSLLQFII